MTKTKTADGLSLGRKMAYGAAELNVGLAFIAINSWLLYFFVNIAAIPPFLAGIAFLKGLGHVHAISHMIGAEYNTQHGLTNAIILPVVLRFNLPGMDDKVARMASSMGFDDGSVEGFIAEIEKMLNRLAIPRSLSEIGVPTDCAGRIAEKAMQDSAAGTNPRTTSLAEMQVLVETAIAKAR